MAWKLPRSESYRKCMGILKQSLDEMKPTTNLNQLKNHLEKAWKEINPEYLENIVLGMPGRIIKCLEYKGDYRKMNN